MEQTNKLPSRFQIGDEVSYDGLPVKVISVQFTKSEVFYEVASDAEYFGLVDSIYVSPVEKQERV